MTIKNIAESIINRLSEDKFVVQPSIGRADVVFDKDKQIIWLIRNERAMSTQFRRDIKGNITGGEIEQPVTSSEDELNLVINRDSKMGALLNKRTLGKHKFTKLDGFEADVLINSISLFEPYFIVTVDAVNGEILVSNDVLRFKSLNEEIRKWKEIEQLELKLKDKEATESLKKILIEQIKQKQKEIEVSKEFKKHYIIASAALRDQPVLDSIQDDLRRIQILDGKLITTGGPGSGKTTSLIQRITFLTSPSIEEYKKDLSKNDKSILYDQSRSWIFFSPSQLLRHYLQDIMIKEGLESDSARVVVWELYRKILFRQFGLINTETQRPFQATLNEDMLFSFDSKSLNDSIEAFHNYFINKQKDKLKKIYEFSIDNYEWSELANMIKENLEKGMQVKSLLQFLSFYGDIMVKYFDKAKFFFEKYNLTLDNSTAEIQILIGKNQELSSNIETILRTSIIKVDTEDEEITEEDIDEIVKSKEFDLTTELNRILRRIIRKLSLYEIDKQTRMSPLERQIHDLVKDMFSTLNIKEIGALAIFRKHYYKILRGFEVNVFSEFPLTYKQFRKEVLLKNDLNVVLNLGILESYISEGNKRVHREEMDFILLLLLNLIHTIYIADRDFIKNSSHIYIKEFNNLTKAVVAIDEATDFSLLELACMSYICHPKFRSVTLSGDLMQRIEHKGIRSWNDYIEMFKDTKLGTLKKSYRQTANLLNIAKRIYSKNTGEELDITPAYPYSANDPDPLLYKGTNFDKKIEWITERILNIHVSYGNKLPSIAMFFNNDNKLREYENALNSSKIFEDNDIRSEVCSEGKLGDAQNVRLFNIKYIKGMEFEAVFYIDIDEMDTSDDNLIDRLLYIGISRASFYLAITVNEDLPVRLDYLSDLFREGAWD